MAYNKDKMAAIYKAASYDSDEDLSEDQRKQIKDKENVFDDVAADTIRKESWENAGVFPKLGKMVKSAFSKDIREKTPEQEQAIEQEMTRRKRLFPKS